VALREIYVPLANDVMRKMRVPFAWPDRRILEEVLSRQDLVHVHFPFWLGIRAIALARRAGIPVVSTFHVQAEHLLHNVGIRSQTLVDWLYRFFLRTVYDRSDLVVCPSAFAERELRRYGLEAPTAIISNGIPPEFRPIDRGACPGFGGKFVVLSAGRFAPEKRQDLLVEAVRRSRHEARIQLVLIGDGPRRERLEEQGRALTHPPVFRYLAPEELVPWYNAADLYVHAAEVEVECMTVLEAMGCGTPCLIARAPKSATSQFALSEAFLYESGALDDLTRRIDWWIQHPAELQAARAATRAASERYRIDASLEKLEASYARAIRSVKARAVRAEGATATPGGR
jgi:glycosyltransferase involved in cell wall biosynthesis